MRVAGKIFWGTLSTLLASSCFDPPQFPIVPEISFEGLRFVDTPDPSPFELATDSLVLEVSFKDGNGDLGLGSNEGVVSGPDKKYYYHDRWYYTKETIANCDDDPLDDVKRCSELRLEELSKYVNYKLKRVPVNGSDTLKAFVKPYNCTNWQVVRDRTGTVVDTVYFQLNPYYNNIFVEFQVKEANTSCGSPPCFSVFDWSQFLEYPNCGVQGFDGRFPYLNTESLGPTPLAGVIKYSMPSPFFKTIFGARTMRLRVYIVDRELNKSNEILTPEFTLRPQ
jgi:hypothetical protein